MLCATQTPGQLVALDFSADFSSSTEPLLSAFSSFGEVVVVVVVVEVVDVVVVGVGRFFFFFLFSSFFFFLLSSFVSSFSSSTTSSSSSSFTSSFSFSSFFVVVSVAASLVSFLSSLFAGLVGLLGLDFSTQQRIWADGHATSSRTSSHMREAREWMHLPGQASEVSVCVTEPKNVERKDPNPAACWGRGGLRTFCGSPSALGCPWEASTGCPPLTRGLCCPWTARR